MKQRDLIKRLEMIGFEFVRHGGNHDIYVKTIRLEVKVMKVTYPVIFTEVETNILIEVPDLEILTEANEEGKMKGSIADAIMMARDAIGITCIEKEDKGEEIVCPSRLLDIDMTQGTFYQDGKSYVSLVDVDLVIYRRMLDNKTVRRNVTLPNWLNQEAEKAKVNVSKVLQEALMTKLGVNR